MPLQTWTGNISGSADHVADTHQQTGNVTILDSTTFQHLITGATTQASINPWNVTGNFSYNIPGKILADGAYKKLIPFQSSAGTLTYTAWAGFNFQGVDAGSSMTFCSIEDAGLPLDYESTYAGNLTLNNILLKNCDRCIRSATTSAVTIGAVEITHCGDNGSGDPIFLWGANGTTTITTLYIHDCGAFANHSFTQGTLTITNLYATNIRTFTVARGSGTPSITITNIYTSNASLNFSNWTSGTLSVGASGGGVISNNATSMYSTCLNTLVTEANVDIYQSGARYVSTSGGNYSNQYLEGGNSGSVAYDSDSVDATTGGTVDGVADVNTANFPNTDSRTSVRATPNKPKTITSVSLGSETTGGFTATFTVNYPGRCWLVISETNTTVNHFDELASFEVRSPVHYDQVIDYAGTGKTQFVTAARTIAVTGLKAGTTYYAYVVVQPLFASDPSIVFYQSAGSIATVSTADTTAPTFAGIASATDAVTSKEVTVAWLAGSDNVAIQGYDIYYSTTNTSAAILAAGVRQSAPDTATSAVIGGLTNGTTYYFIIRARDTSGNRDSNVVIASATPTAADAVSYGPFIAVMADANVALMGGGNLAVME